VQKNLTRPVPHRADDAGLPRSLLQDLLLRRVLFDGRGSTLALSDALRLSPALVQELVDQLRDMRLIEIDGLERRNYFLSLTKLGEERTRERLTVSQYAGPAPVALADYVEVVSGSAPTTNIDAARMRAAFADLVISDQLLDELGPAFRTRGAMFLYGPPGTGKSAIAERMERAYDDEILVPYAIEVHGQVITVFDPLLHEAVPEQPAGGDPRWVACRRPCIVVGGELVAGQLDLEWEPHSGTYRAPLQLQANGGTLVIDDFGRQTLSPDALLNRWILPLDRGTDYLTLAQGTKLQVPFTPKIVLSTNLAPEALGDEAFFRRMRSKVLIPPIQDAQFDEVLRRVVTARGIAVDAGVPEHLRHVARTKGDGDLRPYLPGAVCDLVESICDYEQRPRRLDRVMVDRVADLYFTHTGRSPDRSPGITRDTEGRSFAA
jgi:DNA-binding MarR family transcriptional regulator